MNSECILSIVHVGVCSFRCGVVCPVVYASSAECVWLGVCGVCGFVRFVCLGGCQLLALVVVGSSETRFEFDVVLFSPTCCFPVVLGFVEILAVEVCDEIVEVTGLVRFVVVRPPFLIGFIFPYIAHGLHVYLWSGHWRFFLNAPYFCYCLHSSVFSKVT